MHILTVIPLQKGAFKEELTYFSAQNVTPGSTVVISIRNKKMLGLVIDSSDAREAKSEIKDMDFNLRKIIEIKDTSLWRPEFMEAALDTSKYFAANKSSVISYLIPSSIAENYDKILKTFKEIKIPDDTLKTSNNIKIEKSLFQTSLEERVSSYKTLVREAFANKKSVFIVLPTEREIENFKESLQKGIEDFIFAFHSGLSAKKTLSMIEKMLSTDHAVLVIATAPYLCIPRNDIQTIILEHESSSSYRTIGNSQLDLRVFVEMYATKINARLILGDTLLRFETIARKELDLPNELWPVSFRVSFEGETEIIEKNKKNFLGEEKFKVMSDTSIEEIKDALFKNKNVFVFTLRKGLATFTVCRNCGTEVLCEECCSPVVLYQSHSGTKRMFVCNKCKSTKDPLTKCSHCGSWDLLPLGIGTDTVYEEILKNLPPESKSKVFKLDKDSAKNLPDALKIIQEFEGSNGAVLVGTELALFYLKNKVDRSIIASFDSLWSIPNFKMSEKILQIILHLLYQTKKKLIIETKNPEDGALRAVRNGNFMSYIREELEDRKQLGYPPYKRLLKLKQTGEKKDAPELKRSLSETFAQYEPTIFGAYAEKSREKYTTTMLLKLKPKSWSLPELSSAGEIDERLYQKILELPRGFKVIIDPEDLM